MPQNVDFVQHLVVPLGEVISLELHGVVLSADNCGGGGGGGEASDELQPVNESVMNGHYNGDGGAAFSSSSPSSSAERVTTSSPEWSGNLLEIYDNYADVNGTKWILCAKRDRHGNRPVTSALSASSSYSASRASGAGGQRHGDYSLWDEDRDSSPVFITSHLNTLHIRQRSGGSSTSSTSTKRQLLLNVTVKVYEDKSYRPKLASKDVWVESCQPNPCQFGGKCIETTEMKKCECRGHYSGRFCGLTICDFDPCLFGTCELTATSFKCNCLPGYRGETCEQKKRPCAENPCQGRGECFEKNNGFFCR